MSRTFRTRPIKAEDERRVWNADLHGITYYSLYDAVKSDDELARNHWYHGRDGSVCGYIRCLDGWKDKRFASKNKAYAKRRYHVLRRRRIDPLFIAEGLDQDGIFRCNWIKVE